MSRGMRGFSTRCHAWKQSLTQTPADITPTQVYAQFLRRHHGRVVAAGSSTHSVYVVHFSAQITAASRNLPNQGSKVLRAGIASRPVDLGVQIGNRRFTQVVSGFAHQGVDLSNRHDVNEIIFKTQLSRLTKSEPPNVPVTRIGTLLPLGA